LIPWFIEQVDFCALSFYPLLSGGAGIIPKENIVSGGCLSIT